MATLGSPAIDRVGQYGNVVTYYRALIELANPSTVAGYVVTVAAYFTIVRAGQTGYVATFIDEGSGVYSTRDYEAVVFPDAVGLKEWAVVLDVAIGDYIGIVLPIAATAGDIGIDAEAGASNVRHIQTITGMPIVSETFALYTDNIMSLQGTTGIPLPTVTTQAVTNIAPESLTGNGTITDMGGDAVTQHGHCWDTAANPTVALTTKTEKGAAPNLGQFSSSITGLTPGTLYYIRAYATNSGGTGYGADVTNTQGSSLGRRHIWIEDKALHYFDEYGTERILEGTAIAAGYSDLPWYYFFT